MTARVTLRDGATVGVRPISAADREALAAGFERLSPLSRYRRFFAPIDRLSPSQLDFLTDVDHHDHEALVAFAPEGEKLVGVARFVRTEPTGAEAAIVVADDWHHRGVASALLDRLVHRAREEGIDTFHAAILSENAAAIRLFRGLGDSQTTGHGREIEMRIALPDPAAAPNAPEADSLRALLRAAAAGTVDPLLSFWHRLVPARLGAGEADDLRADVLVAAVDLGHGDGGERVVDAALELARPLRAELVLVAARRPVVADHDHGVEQLSRFVARLRRNGVTAHEVVRPGDLAAVTLDIARERRARLIVVAAGEPPGGPAGRLLGEPWDHISHHAPCSVFVARAR